MTKIIIIGAGIAGMSAGIYGQMNGFETEIYESHSIPGGECTGWNRGEYHFDGCIHYLSGSNPGTALNKLWQQVGALDDTIHIHNHEYFYQYEEKGKNVKIYRDVNRLEKHLLDLAPEDSRLIHEMCKAIRVLKKMEMPVENPMDMASFLDVLKMIDKTVSMMSYYKKYNGITIKDFAEQFKQPVLQRAFQFEIPNRYSAISLLLILAGMNTGDCGWPMGGSKEFTHRMEKKYLSLGGKIHYKSKIEKINIADGKAMGVTLTDGSKPVADYVVSAADGYATLFGLLQGKYLDEKFEKLYSDQQTYPIYTTVQVSLGVSVDLSGHPHMLFFKPANPIHAGGVFNEYMGTRHFCYDEAMAPKGKSVITVVLDADYDWWKEKRQSPEIYQMEKKRVADEVMRAVEERFPECRGNFEQVDVVTPLTYERYCNAWRGAWMAWMKTPHTDFGNLTGKLPGLSRFYMTGQWTMPPGGLPGAVVSGKFTIQRICKELGRNFQSISKKLQRDMMGQDVSF
jgi:phytoene dehydrogenase-like protein